MTYLCRKCRHNRPYSRDNPGDGPCAVFLEAVSNTAARNLCRGDMWLAIPEPATEALPCPFCGGECDPEGWASDDGKRGPECDDCGVTAPDLKTWNTRA